MALAKRLGRPRANVAEEILGRAELSGVAAWRSRAGFLNLTLSPEFLADSDGLRDDDRLGIEAVTQTKTVVIDYSAPNVAKEMHVGTFVRRHRRALARCTASPDTTFVARNHVGDWGTPFAMLIEHLLDSGEGDDATLSIGDLDAFYKEARTKFDADDSFKERSRSRVSRCSRVTPRRCVSGASSWISRSPTSISSTETSGHAHSERRGGRVLLQQHAERPSSPTSPPRV